MSPLLLPWAEGLRSCPRACLMTQRQSLLRGSLIMVLTPSLLRAGGHTPSWWLLIAMYSLSYFSFAAPSPYRPYGSDGLIMNQEARQDSSSSSAPQDYSDHSRDLSSNSSSKGTHVENSNQSSAHGVETPVGGLAQLPFSPRDL